MACECCAALGLVGTVTARAYAVVNKGDNSIVPSIALDCSVGRVSCALLGGSAYVICGRGKAEVSRIPSTGCIKASVDREYGLSGVRQCDDGGPSISAVVKKRDAAVWAWPSASSV